jgi:hypothetical protein
MESAKSMTKATCSGHRRRWLGALVVAGLFALPAQGSAQPAGAAPPRWDPAQIESERAARRAARREERERLHSEVLDQMRAIRMWKLTEELKLDQATAAKVFPLLAEFDDRSRDIGRERFEIAREVNTQMRSGRPDDKQLQVLINRLLANQNRRQALEDDRWKALRPSLTPLQQAKLLLLLPRLEDDFRRRIREAVEEQRRLRLRDRDPDSEPSPTKD